MLTMGTLSCRKSGNESFCGWIFGLESWIRNATPRLWRLAASNVISQTGDKFNLPGPVWTSRQSQRMYNTSTNGKEAFCSSLWSKLALAHGIPVDGAVYFEV